MTFRNHNCIISIIFLLILLGSVAACVPQGPIETTTPSTTTGSPTKTSNPTKTPTNLPAASPQPLGIYLPQPLPAGLLDNAVPVFNQRNDHSNNTLWFGSQAEAPQGDILAASNWVYALAAPFPTIIDDLSEDDLQQLWFGTSSNPAVTTTKLYVPTEIASILKNRWGAADESGVTVVRSLPDPETLWEENAWALVPFEGLQPKLKVLSIDGQSPLHKDFNSQDYPLRFEYQLIMDRPINSAYQAEDIQALIGAIEPTNRNPDKMTTLIMTGVTALVRATAYRMELYGVDYPGEEIGDWLREADITHLSNEVSFYEDCPFPNPKSTSLLFCSDPKYIDLFDYVGADIIELTGNHNNDPQYVYGKDVIPFTMDLYEQYHIKTYGGGRNITEAKSPRIITHNGNRFAFIGCNAPGPDFAWATEDHGGAAPCGDYQWMIDEISRLKNEGYLPIATLQYYEDYYNYAESHHIRDFTPLAKAGAVIVNGSQAHRPKGFAFLDDSFIDYGLGNLFFDQMIALIDGKAIPQTGWEEIQRHTIYNGRLLSIELLTAQLQDFAQPRPMTDKERIQFLEELFTASGWNPR